MHICIFQQSRKHTPKCHRTAQKILGTFHMHSDGQFLDWKFLKRFNNTMCEIYQHLMRAQVAHSIIIIKRCHMCMWSNVWSMEFFVEKNLHNKLKTPASRGCYVVSYLVGIKCWRQIQWKCFISFLCQSILKYTENGFDSLWLTWLGDSECSNAND